MPSLLIETREEILKLLAQCKSKRKIALECNCFKFTVSHISEKFALFQTIDTLPGYGRKRCLSPSDVRFIKLFLMRDRRLTLPKLVSDWNSCASISVCTTAIRDVLSDCGLHGKVACKKPLLRPANVKKTS